MSRHGSHLPRKATPHSGISAEDPRVGLWKPRVFFQGDIAWA